MRKERPHIVRFKPIFFKKATVSVYQIYSRVLHHDIYLLYHAYSCCITFIITFIITSPSGLRPSGSVIINVIQYSWHDITYTYTYIYIYIYIYNIKTDENYLTHLVGMLSAISLYYICFHIKMVSLFAHSVQQKFV